MDMQNALRHFAGFTLTEIIIVIMLLGIILGLGIPRYLVAIEKSRAKEGENALLTMLSATKRYTLESGTPPTAYGQLDIDFNNLQFFGTPSVDSSSSSTCAQIIRIGNLYTLKIDLSGTITCTNGAQVWCSSLGY